MELVHEYFIEFGDLEISSAEIAEFMGFIDGEVPEPFPEVIGSALSEADALCELRAGFRIIESIETDVTKASVSLLNQTFSCGKIVAAQLKNAEKIAVIAGTAGKAIYEKARLEETEGDLVKAFVYDTIGSVSAAKTMWFVCNKLRSYATETGLGLSDHYSPGYCDWSVSDQHKLFSLLPEKFCGITLLDSSLMEPVKSVSGIVGIGNGLREIGMQCHWCNDVNCHYGKINRKKNQ
jgi:hypothetical protein